MRPRPNDGSMTFGVNSRAERRGELVGSARQQNEFKRSNYALSEPQNGERGEKQPDERENEAHLSA